MKICVLGAAGKTGRRIVAAALATGRRVTALVRDANKLADSTHANLEVRAISFEDEAQLIEAMRGHDAIVNAAGYITAGGAYIELVGRIIRAASSALGQGGRFWLFGGAALLDVPGKSMMTLDLPGVPKIFEAHRINYRAVEATSLDWSMLCPGPMLDAPNGEPTSDLIVSLDQWPVVRPAYTYFLPRPALALAFKNAVPRMTIYYEDAAKLIVGNLESNGPYARRRVGIALANGAMRTKQVVPS